MAFDVFDIIADGRLLQDKLCTLIQADDLRLYLPYLVRHSLQDASMSWLLVHLNRYSEVNRIITCMSLDYTAIDMAMNKSGSHSALRRAFELGDAAQQMGTVVSELQIVVQKLRSSRLAI